MHQKAIWEEKFINKVKRQMFTSRKGLATQIMGTGVLFLICKEFLESIKKDHNVMEKKAKGISKYMKGWLTLIIQKIHVITIAFHL